MNGGLNIKIVAMHARQIVPIIGKHLQRDGGYLFICNGKGRSLFHGVCGAPLADKAPFYKIFSKEKAQRLFSHPEHQCSWESRDPNKDQYGGAIRLKSGLIVSFSGFPEKDDAPLAGLIAVKSGLATPKEIHDTLELQDPNEMFSNGIELFAKMTTWLKLSHT